MAPDRAPQPPAATSSSFSAFFPACFVAVVAAAGYEGVAAARATRAADAGWTSSFLAFTAASAVMFAFATPLASGASLVARGASSWLARGPRLRPSFAWRSAVYIGLIGHAATLASIAGRKIIGSMSPHFAATMIVVLALSAGGAALLLSRLVIAGLDWLPRSRFLAKPAQARAFEVIDSRGGPLALSLVTLVVANALLPSEQFATPAVALVAAAVFSASPWALAASRRGSFVQKSALVLALVSLVLLRGVEKLPSRARLAVIYRTPWTSLTLGAVRSLVDRDRDGYSPILGGGDCNDGDARVHPDAVDIPGDGIDQNCSGADAPLPTRDPSEPRVKRTPSSETYTTAAVFSNGGRVDAVRPSREAASASARETDDSAAHAKRPDHASFVFVHIDALRPDHLGFAGYSRKVSPNLDAFRADATYFSQAYTLAPATRFAMASLFTGRDVDHVAVKRGVALDMTLQPEANTIAEQLGAAGYDRVGYSISYVMQHMAGIGQGFRVWETPWPVADGDSYIGRDAPMTTDRAIAYLDGRGANPAGASATPFMMYTHYQCTHAPYVKHAEWDFGDADVDRYDSALAYCDREVGRLLGAIRRQADHDRIAVVIFSDHGELLGEHGFTNHGTSLFQEELRALLLVRFPWAATPSTVDARVTLTDLYPTVLELAGLPADPTTRAWNLLPLLDGSSRGDDWQRPLYLYIDQWRGSVHLEERGVLDGPYKYVKDVASGASFLFDERSPREVTNLQNALPADRDRLAGMLDARASLD